MGDGATNAYVENTNIDRGRRCPNKGPATLYNTGNGAGFLLLFARASILLCCLLWRGEIVRADSRNVRTYTILDLEFTQRSLGNTAALSTPKGSTTHECFYQGHGGYQCIGEHNSSTSKCGQRRFLSPYPILTNHISDCEGNPLTVVWGPSALGRDGVAFVAALNDGLKKPIHSCKDRTCDVVYRTNSVELHGSPVVGLARCQTTKTGLVIGPPTRCIISALEWRNQTFIPLVTGFDPAAPWMGAPDFSFELYSKTSIKTDKIMLALRDKLRNQFSLSVDPQADISVGAQNDDMIIASADPQYSKSIAAYQWITVRVDHYLPAKPAPVSERRHGFVLQSRFLVTLTLLVNKRNTTREGEWHLPDSVTFKRLLSDIKSSLGLALRDLCSKSWWDNAQQMYCEV